MPARKYSDETLAKMAAMRERGKSYEQIARILHMSTGAVSWHCLRLGADSPKNRLNKPPATGPMEMKRGNHVVRRFTPAEDAELLRRATAGESRTDIAIALNRRRNSVVGRLMTLARHEERRELIEQAEGLAS